MKRRQTLDMELLFLLLMLPPEKLVLLIIKVRQEFLFAAKLTYSADTDFDSASIRRRFVLKARRRSRLPL